MRARRVNICFHGIGTPRRELEPGEEPYWIDVDCYHAVLDVVADRPDVRLSFDDSNSSDLEIGLPGLVERGLRATFFVLAGRMGRPGSLGAGEVRELMSQGMRIGSHGMDHVPWRGLDDTARRRELVDARVRLEDELGRPVDEAALPLGRYDRTLLRHLRGLGYRTVYTSDRRPARDGSWLQPRFSVRAGDTAESVRETMLTPPPLAERARLAAVGQVKRLR